MIPKWRRSVVVPFNIEKVVEPMRSKKYWLANLTGKIIIVVFWGFWI
jgi:hypothetical protein